MKYCMVLATVLLTFEYANAQRMYDDSGKQIRKVNGDRYYDGPRRQI